MRKFLFIICLLFLNSSFADDAVTFKNLESKPKNALRVVTYNLFWKNGVCKGHKFDITSYVIKKTNADIVLLQETTPSWKRCLNRSLSHIYPYKKYKHYSEAGGLAILSKYPFKTKKYLYSKRFLRHPAWLVNVQTQFGNIDLFNIHLRPSVDTNNKIGFLGRELFHSPRDRANEMHYLYRFLNINKPTIIAGDFNETYGSSTLMLSYNGWIDTLALDDKDVSTWHWKVGPLTLKQQYDKIFVSPHFRVLNAQVLHEGISDHFPVIIDLR